MNRDQTLEPMNDDKKNLYLYSPTAGRKVNMGLTRSRDIDNPESLSSILDVVRYIGWHRCNNRYYYEQRHKTKDNLIIVCVSGKGVFEREGTVYSITPGSVVIFPNDIDVAYYTDPATESWEIYWMHLRGDNASNVLRHLYGNNIYLTQCQDIERYASIFEEIMNSLLEGYSLTLFCANKIQELLCHILGDCFSNGQVFSESNDLVKCVTKYVEENYMTDVSISEIADSMFMTSEALIRAFRRHTGFTPYAYLKRYRISCAEALLLNTDLSVKEIAGKVGYKSVSNFIAEFRSVKKITPKRYRTEVN